MDVLYDPECHKLAQHFLYDYPLATAKDAAELAGVIQKAIEDWMEEKRLG